MPNLERSCSWPLAPRMKSSVFLCLILQLGTVDDDSLEEFYSKSVSLNKQQCQVLLRLTLRRTGCFRTRISYKDQLLSNGEFDIIVLSGEHLLHAASSSNEDIEVGAECVQT